MWLGFFVTTLFRFTIYPFLTRYDALGIACICRKMYVHYLDKAMTDFIWVIDVTQLRRHLTWTRCPILIRSAQVGFSQIREFAQQLRLSQLLFPKLQTLIVHDCLDSYSRGHIRRVEDYWLQELGLVSELILKSNEYIFVIQGKWLSKNIKVLKVEAQYIIFENVGPWPSLTSLECCGTVINDSSSGYWPPGVKRLVLENMPRIPLKWPEKMEHLTLINYSGPRLDNVPPHVTMDVMNKRRRL